MKITEVQLKARSLIHPREVLYLCQASALDAYSKTITPPLFTWGRLHMLCRHNRLALTAMLNTDLLFPLVNREAEHRLCTALRSKSDQMEATVTSSKQHIVSLDFHVEDLCDFIFAFHKLESLGLNH